MIQINIEDTPLELSRLLELIRNGEEVVLTEAGQPAARLVPYQADNQKVKADAQSDKTSLNPKRVKLAESLAQTRKMIQPPLTEDEFQDLLNDYRY